MPRTVTVKFISADTNYQGRFSAIEIPFYSRLTLRKGVIRFRCPELHRRLIDQLMKGFTVADERDEDPSPKKGYTISDKRRFASSGDSKSSASESNTTTVTKPSAEAAKSEPSDASEMPITFTAFMMSLATQTMAQLGDLKIPGVEKNVPGAKQTIEIIEMLQEKTKGNLDTEESHLLEEILHSVRMSFVRASKAG